MECWKLPGGMPGTLHLKEHEGLRETSFVGIWKDCRSAAICAAPIYIGKSWILGRQTACAYPSFEGKDLTGAAVVQETDGNRRWDHHRKRYGSAMCFHTGPCFLFCMGKKRHRK